MRQRRTIHTSRIKAYDVTIRGTANQLATKYAELATQAMREKDSVQAETFYQHAYHYAVLHAEGM